MPYQDEAYRCRVAELAQRLRSIFGVVDAGNGTELADALAVALIVDLRLSSDPDGSEKLHKLGSHEVVAAGTTLQMTLRKQGWGFALPLGTTATPAWPGSIRFGDETWALVAGTPGLHPINALRHDAHGPNLELLRRRIRSMTRNLACRRLGLPYPMTVFDGGALELLRFAPFVEAHDVILERKTYGIGAERFCSALPEQIEHFAASIVKDMRVLWQRRREIGVRIAAVRKSAEIAASGVAVDFTLNGVTIDLCHRHVDDVFPVTLEFLATDDAMRDGMVREYVGTHRTTRTIGLSTADLVDRTARRETLAAAGADGWIDQLAIAIAQAAPEGSAAVLRRLAHAYETIVQIPSVNCPTFATLSWQDGRVTTQLYIPGLYWEGRNIELDGAVPDSVLACLPGRRLTDLIELPFCCDCIISVAERGSCGMLIQLEVQDHYLDCRTGRTWAAPQAD